MLSVLAKQTQLCALEGGCTGSVAGVIISARHLMGITVTAGAIPLFLGQEVWELESGGVEKFFLCGGLDGLRSHWEMPPRRPEPPRCLEMPRSGEKKQFKACVETHFTILAFNMCVHTPQQQSWSHF